MKFGQSIDHNMRNIFLEKPYIKCGAGTTKNENWAYLGVTSVNIYKDVYCKSKLRITKHTETEV